MAPHYMPFGKYTGERLRDVPSGYLVWLLDHCDLYPDRNGSWEVKRVSVQAQDLADVVLAEPRRRRRPRRGERQQTLFDPPPG